MPAAETLYQPLEVQCGSQSAPVCLYLLVRNLAVIYIVIVTDNMSVITDKYTDLKNKLLLRMK